MKRFIIAALLTLGASACYFDIGTPVDAAGGLSNVNVQSITSPTVAGTLSSVGGVVTSADLSGWGGVTIQVESSCTGCTAVPEVSSDGTNYHTISVSNVDGSGAVSSISTTGMWQATISGIQRVRLRMSARTSGSWSVTIKGSVAGGPQTVGVTVNNTTTGNAAASTTGAAVPVAADYQGINIGGNLVGETGLSVGSHYAAVVAIVDASGNQITSFGGAGGTASNINSTFPSVATAIGFNDGTNMQGARIFDVDSSGSTEYVVGMNLRKISSGGSVEAGTSSDPLRIDPTGTTTQPVSLASVPTHAVTQSGTWNIGTVTSATVVGDVAAAAADSGNPVKIGGKYSSTLPTLTDGQRGNVQLDSRGRVLVNVDAGSAANAAASATGSAVPSSADYQGIDVGGTLRGVTGASLGSHFAEAVMIVDGSGNQVTSFGGSGGTASNYTSAFPASGTAVGFSDGTNMQGARVYDTDSGGGTQYTLGAVLRLSSNGGSVEGGTASNPIRVDPTGTTTQPVSLASVPTHAVTQSGTWNMTQSGTWTVQPGNVANTTAWLVKQQVNTPVLVNALSTTVTTVTGSAGILDTYFCHNPNTATAYIQIFDISGSVTLGSSTPKWSIAIPAGGSGNLAQMALNFANAIKVAATQTATGSSAPTTALDCNFGYR